MEEHLLVNLVSVISIGITAQWIAMRMKIPSILFLLIFGFLAGPVFHFIDPDAIFGNLLFPIVSLSVAIILFEGGMDLKRAELKEIGGVVRNLISIGTIVTWVLTTLAAHFILQWNLSLSVLLGAILVVTGPTVIGPLLRHVRPSGKVGNVLKWEGIVNDPIGIALAVLVFECILLGDLNRVGLIFAGGIVKTLVIGFFLGGAGAWILTVLLKRYLIPDALQEVVTLMFIFIIFVTSNHFQAESGLLSVTLMGIILVNQRSISVHHILKFKENLRVLIIGILFILLSARLRLSDFQYLNWTSIVFLILLIFVIRPLSVFIACRGNDLTWKEKIFVSCMAPRGIVAAATASIFAHDLIKIGHPQVEQFVPMIFLVIITTVAVYGLFAKPIAKWLKLAESNPQGILFIGAHPWSRKIASYIKNLGYKVILADTNYANVMFARSEGLESFHGNVFGENIEDEVDLSGIGRLMALTSNDEANSLATIHFRSIFGMQHIYQLATEKSYDMDLNLTSSKKLQGRELFNESIHFQKFSTYFASGGKLETINLGESFTYEDFKNKYGDKALPLFYITQDNQLQIVSCDKTVSGPVSGDKIIFLEVLNIKNKNQIG